MDSLDLSECFSSPESSKTGQEDSIAELLAKAKGRIHFEEPAETPVNIRPLRALSLAPLFASECKVLGGVYWVDRSVVFLDKTKLRKEFESLILEPRGMPGQWMPSIHGFYDHPTKLSLIGLPRFLGLSLFGKPTQDLRQLGTPMSTITSTEISLRPLQIQAVDQALEVLETFGGTTSIADCGFGKTRLAIAIASKLKRRTLILCNREVLMKQWSTVVRDLTPWTISWLQGSSFHKAPKEPVGLLSADNLSSDVCIGSIDTLVDSAVPKEITNSFGLVIVDEMHHLAAATLVHALPKLPARYIVALSATPDRRDGLEYFLYWLAGPTSFVYKRLPSVTGVRDTVEVRAIMAVGTAQRERMYRNGSLAFAEMANGLAEDPRRNEYLLKAIDVCIQEGRKKIIVVSSLVNHCTHLHAAIATKYIDMPMALMCGKTVESNKAKDPATRIVFATYSLLEEGYDDDRLDTLVLALPRSRIQQTIGRVERTHEGKLRPLVIDLVDTFSVYPSMFCKRTTFYKSRGFEIVQT